MRKHLLKSLAFLLLGVMISLECLSGYATINSHAAGNTQSSYYLYPFEEAVEALEQLASEQEIQAAVYLADEVNMKALPEESSETVRVLASGDVVRIIGVGQDADYGIWYEAVFQQETEKVVGYISRSYLACTQTEFMEWESNYVRSATVFRRMARVVSYPDVEQFPESYQDALYQLKQQYPNWIFVKMNTGISWKTLVSNQLGERSLIYAPTSPDGWKNGMYGTNWAYASEGILKYYLDPRNFLDDNGIFQFELLGYSEEYHTVEAVNHILNGTFMYNATIENGKTYAQNFVELGQSTQVSPFLMASRIRQEQGAQGNSALISGTYTGFEGYYNYYNIGASGKTDKEIIESGLARAKKEGWNSRYKALEAGANFLGSSYIKHGQDTLYLQKFDVDSRYDGVFWHQYMQNIEAPYKESLSVKRAYEKASLIDSAYIFRIPVYEGMPSSASVLPGQEDKITLSSTEIDNLQVDAQVTLHPFINGEEAEGIEWEFISSDTAVATVDAQGVVTALKPGETLITCRKKEDMDNTIEGTCRITVIKADVDISKLTIPQLEPITYNSKAVLGDISLPEGYSWANPELVPTVKQTAYAVEYNLDDSKYNSIILDIPLTVNKAIPEITVPTGLQGGATRDLSSVQLPKGYYWMEPEAKLPGTVGTATFRAGYNPDIENYESVENINLTVKVICDKHNFGEWRITEATCDVDGIKVRSCTICGEKEEIVLPATGHSYEAEVIKEATEKQEGERLYTCVNCRHSYTESIPRLPAKHEHSYQKEVVKKASCTTEGLLRYTCSCGDTYEEVILATGHSMKEGSCTICGYKESSGTGTSGTGSVINQGGSTNSTNTSQGGNTTAGGNTGQSSGTTSGGNTNQGSGTASDGNTSQGGNTTAGGNTGQSSGTTSGGNTNQNGGTTTGGSTSGSTNSGNASGNSTANSGTGAGSTGSTTAGNTTTSQSTGSTAAGNTTTGQSTGSTTTGNAATSKNTGTAEGAANSAAGNTTAPAGNTTSGSTGNTRADVTAAPANAEEQIIADAVKQVKQENGSTAPAKEEKVIIALNGNNTRISDKVVDTAVSHGVDLELELPNTLVWIIDARSLTGALTGEIDMDARFIEGILDRKWIEATAKGRDYLELQLAHTGDFGFTADLIIPVEEKYIGKTANLFYFNEETGMLEFQMASGVSEEAEVIFTFTHASDYLIVFADGSMAEETFSANTQEIEVSEDASAVTGTVEKEENNSLKILVFITLIIMLLAVFLVIWGLWLNHRKQDKIYNDQKEEMPDGEEDFFQELAASARKEIREEKKRQEEKKSLSEDEYFDEDVDDYRERS